MRNSNLRKKMNWITVNLSKAQNIDSEEKKILYRFTNSKINSAFVKEDFKKQFCNPQAVKRDFQLTVNFWRKNICMIEKTIYLLWASQQPTSMLCKKKSSIQRRIMLHLFQLKTEIWIFNFWNGGKTEKGERCKTNEERWGKVKFSPPSKNGTTTFLRRLKWRKAEQT